MSHNVTLRRPLTHPLTCDLIYGWPLSSLSRAKIFQPTAGLTYTYRQTDREDHAACLVVTSISTSRSPAVFEFLDLHFRYKSIPIQIPYDPGWIRNPYTSAAFHSTSSKHLTLNLAATGPEQFSNLTYSVD